MENPPQNQRYGKEQLDEEQLQLLPRSFVPPWSPPWSPPWKSKGKTLAGDSGNKRTIGVRIASQDVLQTNGMILEDAPKDLNVVDEVGFSQLNFETQSSDQASAVTVDTNSVVAKVIPPPQFSPTAQQGYEDEGFGIDELNDVDIYVDEWENDGMSLADFADKLPGFCLEDFEEDPDGISLDDLANEVGPPLNSNTLPSDQALAVIVDPNSVVGKEIPPLQFSPTAQLKNSDEDFGNEECEIRAERTEEGGIPEVQFDSRCSAKRKREARTPVGERRDKKTTGKHLKVVDEVGFSQLNFDTPSSDQASAVTVDTNSVVAKVIPPLQYSPTAQQGYEDKDFDIDEVEKVEICLERRENDGMSLEDFAKDLDRICLEDFEKDLDGISLDDLAKDLDEVGPPLNSNTLPSDQASTVIVDTSSIVGKEIPPLQFSPTAQLKNSDEDFGNEEGEIRAERTEEGGIPEVQFDSRCSSKSKRKAKTPVGERRDKKTTGKHLKGGTSRNTSMGGLAESNVDINTVGGRASSKKCLTSFSGKGGIKIKNSCLTELTSENEGEVLYNRTFRASLRGIIMLIKELNLRTCHKEVLKRTPFWGIFEAIIDKNLLPTQCRKSDKMIIEIINTYDPVAGIFRLGTESMELTRADMVSIFGISCGNELVSLKYGSKEEVKLVARREISESRLTSRSMKQLLKKYLGSDEKDDVEDVARLLCLYLFHTFLLPTGTTVKWVYLERLEDLDRLRGYDWNGAIINELMSSIRKHHREPRKVTGCVMALLYWLCEHTNLSKADHPEHPLGIVKWNIPLVVSRFKEIRLKDLKPSQVVSRQANVARTVDDEVPVVQDSVSLGDVPVSNKGNNACSGYGKRDEKTPGEERVSRSKLKRDCWDNIHKWPPREEQQLIGQSHPNGSPAVVDQERIPQLNSDTPLPSNQNSSTGNTNSVTVRAKYNEGRIKFKLSWPWRKLELEQEVKKRLQLDAGTYSINYKDEDGEMTLICCDEDLEDHISSTSHQGTHSIDLFLSQSS